MRCDRCGARAATEIKRADDIILTLCQHHTDQFAPELHKQGYELLAYDHTRVGEPV